MKKNSYILLVVFTVIFGMRAAAQESTLLHFMRQSPQSLRTNPANMNDSTTFFMGIPIVSNISVDVLSPLPLSDMWYRDASDSLRINQNLPALLGDNDRMNLGVKWEFLSYGFRFAQKNMITLSMGLSAYGNFRMPADLATFVLQGNEPGGILDIKTDARAAGYLESALGYSRVISDDWKVGVRGKYLVGLAGADGRNMHATITTSADDYSVSLDADALLHTSYPDNFDNIGDVISNTFKNNGFAFDAGVYYKTPVSGLEVSLSFVDWGFINWRSHLTDYRAKMENGAYTFRGLDKLDGDSFDSILDTLKNVFSFDDLAGSGFMTTLPGKIFLSASYDLTKDDKFGFLFSTRALHNFERTMFSLMYNRRVGDILSVSAGNNFYATDGISPLNLCIAFNLKFGNFQFYLDVENISSFKVIDMHGASVQFGMNIAMIKKTQKGRTKNGE